MQTMNSIKRQAVMPDIGPGACESCIEPIDRYLANRAFVSSTNLRRFERSGLVAAQQPNGGVMTGLLMGEAFHSLVLEPELFSSQYLVLDDAGPPQAGLSETDVMNRQWLDAWQWSALYHAREALCNFDRFPVAEWLQRGRKELSVYWRDDAGYGWKARPDCFTPEIVLDLKTTTDCQPRSFARARQRYGYDLQAVHYMDAVKLLTGAAPRFFYLAVELNTPYSILVQELDADELRSARDHLAHLKVEYVRAAQSVENVGTGAPQGAA